MSQTLWHQHSGILIEIGIATSTKRQTDRFTQTVEPKSNTKNRKQTQVNIQNYIWMLTLYACMLVCAREIRTQKTPSTISCSLSHRANKWMSKKTKQKHTHEFRSPATTPQHQQNALDVCLTCAEDGCSYSTADTRISIVWGSTQHTIFQHLLCFVFN